MNHFKIYGRYLILIGLTFLILGFMMMMDGPLMALGNVQLMCGILLHTGINNFVKTFLYLNRIPFTLLFFSGFTLVLMRWALIGIIMQIIAIFYLFKTTLINLYNKYTLYLTPFLPSILSKSTTPSSSNKKK